MRGYGCPVIDAVDPLVTRLRAAGCVFAEEEAALLRGAASGAELEALVVRRLAGEPLEPLLGWADDAVIVPAGLWLASRFIPPQVMDDARQRFAKKPPVK